MSAGRSRILEGVMTTVAAGDGQARSAPAGDFELSAINIAPMGPFVDDRMSRLILRPFTTSTTYRNLKTTGEGVFHVTDDALLIARGAIGALIAKDVSLRRADVVRGVVLTQACRYYEIRVVSLDDAQQRTRIEAEVVHAARLRDFFGFNRARHAVIEAAILATRVHLTGAAHVLAEFDRLMLAVEKTGGEAEHAAMSELRAFVARSPSAPL